MFFKFASIGEICGSYLSKSFKRCSLANVAHRRYTPPTSHKTARVTGGRGWGGGLASADAPIRVAKMVIGGLAGGACMSISCDPLLRHVLRDEALTRGLGDIEARML